jgi:hypothetical protein
MRIPPFARIIAVADAFDSMTSTRSYRGARGSREALTELQANSGSQFDPEIVEAIAAGLARAELAGRPWRGDGTAREGAQAGRDTPADLSELPPGAVVAGFDHDDPAYQEQLPCPIPATPAPAGPRAETEPDVEPESEPVVESVRVVEPIRAVEPEPVAEPGPDVESEAGREAEVVPDLAGSAGLSGNATAHAAAGDPAAADSAGAPAADEGLRLAPFAAGVNVPAQTGRGPDFARGRDAPVDPEVRG